MNEDSRDNVFSLRFGCHFQQIETIFRVLGEKDGNVAVRGTFESFPTLRSMQHSENKFDSHRAQSYHLSPFWGQINWLPTIEWFLVQYFTPHYEEMIAAPSNFGFPTLPWNILVSVDHNKLTNSLSPRDPSI